MKLIRDEQFMWSLECGVGEDEELDTNEYYVKALPRYLTALDTLFRKAKESSEFEFLLSLFRVRGVEGPGWDPYQTTLQSIPALIELSTQSNNFKSSRHLTLWIYGHILEASEPYELIANLLHVSSGGRYNFRRFPNNSNGRPQSIGQKIKKIKHLSETVGIPEVATPYNEIWNTGLRNSIFHADYSLFGGEVRTVSPVKSYSNEEIMEIINKAIAYHFALAYLYRFYIGSYGEHTVIMPHPGFSSDPNEIFGVIIRKNYGAIGLRNILTKEQLEQGYIKFHIGWFYPEEKKLIENDPFLFIVPPQEIDDIYGPLVN